MNNSTITVTDMFCGAGGSSIGATIAGADLRLAMNHWKTAIETHNTNFPKADHALADISSVDPRRYQTTTILIASPECTNHTDAKGKKRLSRQGSLFETQPIDPAAERSRATMWDVPRFAEFHDYKLIVVENVVQAAEWVMFDAWLMAMHALGYDHKIISLNSMFSGSVPQSRDRMYVVFWKRGNTSPDLEFTPLAPCDHCDKDIQAVQCFKRLGQRVGKYRSQYIYCCPHCANVVAPYALPASHAIDWSLSSTKIGERNKPLSEKTMERIQSGIDRYWPASVVQGSGHTYEHGSYKRVWSTDHPVPTQTTDVMHGLVLAPIIAELRGKNGTARSSAIPFSTMCAGGGHHGLVMRDVNGGACMCNPTEEPLRTLTTSGNQSLITQYNGKGVCKPTSLPLGTLPTRERFGVIESNGTVDINDCYFRMLQSHEIGAAMAFPQDYAVSGTQKDKVRQYGNAVTPPVMEMLMRRCMETLA